MIVTTAAMNMNIAIYGGYRSIIKESIQVRKMPNNWNSKPQRNHDTIHDR